MSDETCSLIPRPGTVSPRLGLPRLPLAHVPRPRLSQRLLASDCLLTLICTQAGFGKTVLLNECARQAGPTTRLVWLDLLGHALSPAELLSRLAAALQLAHGDGEPYAELTQLLSRVEGPLWIVLDDYPRQPCDALDSCLDRLLERLPHTLRWWISGRRRPAWNLPRLLLQDDLLELGAQDLALDQPELDALLLKRQVPLAVEHSAQLLQHSEGWLACVCLLLTQGDANSLLARLSESPPLLQEYIAREVLAGLPEPVLHGLSVLARMPRFCAALCEHLMPHEGGARILDDLRQRQLFVQRLDSRSEWLRLASPLATMLARKPASQSMRRVHNRASQWFARQGEVRDAVEHALWAEQPGLAAGYLQRYGQDQLLVGRSGARFLEWRDELPVGLFSSTPRMILLQSWALIMSSRLDEVEPCLADLARFLPQPTPRRQQQLLAQYQTVQGVLQRLLGHRGARQHCLEALQVLVPSAWAQRILCYQMLSQQALAEGELQAADHFNHEGLSLAGRRGNQPFEALLSIERVHLLAMHGETERGLKQIEQLLQDMPEASRRGPVLVRLLLLRGRLLASRGEDDGAKAALRSALDEAERCKEAYLLFGYQTLSELATEQADFDGAQQLLDTAERQMRWLQVPEERYRRVLLFAQGQLWLQRGETHKAHANFTQVLQSLRDGDLLGPSGFYELPQRTSLLLAQTELCLGRPDVALPALRTLEQACSKSGLRSLACECRLVLAEALRAAGQMRAANDQLRRALAEAERLELLQPLRTLYRRQHQWLEHMLPAPAERKGCLQRLNPVRLESPLSKREQAVLSLIAQGCSNQQIAEQLFISLHTVKSHARHINVKLGIERRTQAVARAKACGWLD